MCISDIIFQEITVLHEDIGEKDHETQNLYQSVSEKNDQLEQLNENLQEQQAKVGKYTELLLNYWQVLASMPMITVQVCGYI